MKKTKSQSQPKSQPQTRRKGIGTFLIKNMNHFASAIFGASLCFMVMNSFDKELQQVIPSQVVVTSDHLMSDSQRHSVQHEYDTEKKMASLPQQADHLSLSSISSREFRTEPRTENCIRLSSHGLNRAPFRVFIYQKKGGEQLVNILVHYLQVLTYDEIVIIANEDEDGDLSDNFLYRDIISKGMHLWQCSGTMHVKGERWTEVIRQYQNKTDFVQPVDVDEYLTILSPETKSLIWDRPSLITTLNNLPPASRDKPYKTANSKPVPLDCEAHNSNSIIDLGKHKARHCLITGVTKAETACFSKVFFKGEFFHETDVGNHIGAYGRTQKQRVLKCRAEGVENTFIPTNFVLVHYQVLDFNDWFIHFIRRTVDDKRVQCEKVPEKGWLSFHPCTLIAEAFKTNFSIYHMKKVYKREVCERNSRSYYNTSSITTLTC